MNKRIEKLLRVWCYEVMIFLESEITIELRCNVCNDAIIEERYSSIIILNLTLF